MKKTIRVTVMKSGQTVITLPRYMAQECDIKGGDVLEIQNKNNKIIITKMDGTNE